MSLRSIIGDPGDHRKGNLNREDQSRLVRNNFHHIRFDVNFSVNNNHLNNNNGKNNYDVNNSFSAY